jgi:hypothetical protein
MRYIALLFAVLLVVATVVPTFAANICVQNAFGQFFRFDNVPTPLVKGKTINLRGEFHHNLGTDINDNVPFEGALTLASDGVTTRIGIMTYSSGVATGVIWSMVGDKKFNATGTYDTGALGSPDGNDTWTRVSCAPPFPTPAISPLSLVEGAPVPGVPE